MRVDDTQKTLWERREQETPSYAPIFGRPEKSFSTIKIFISNLPILCHLTQCSSQKHKHHVCSNDMQRNHTHTNLMTISTNRCNTQYLWNTGAARSRKRVCHEKCRRRRWTLDWPRQTHEDLFCTSPEPNDAAASYFPLPLLSRPLKVLFRPIPWRWENTSYKPACTCAPRHRQIFGVFGRWDTEREKERENRKFKFKLTDEYVRTVLLCSCCISQSFNVFILLICIYIIVYIVFMLFRNTKKNNKQV